MSSGSSEHNIVENVEPSEQEYFPKRRARSVNWLREDKNLLMMLVKDKIDIIDNKSIDKKSNNKKAAAWKEILAKFNARCQGGPRTADQARIQYKRIKLDAKKRNSPLYNEMNYGRRNHGRYITLPLSFNNEPSVADNWDDSLDSDLNYQDDSFDENSQLSLFLAQKSERKSYFKKARNCCAALIKDGYTADVLDHTAFKNLLEMIPMTKVERDKLTSKAIEEFISSTDSDDAWSCDESSNGGVDDKENGDDEFEDDKTDHEEMERQAPTKRKVKQESPDWSCPSREKGAHETVCVTIVGEDLSQHIKTEPTEDPTKPDDDGGDSSGSGYINFVEIDSAKRIIKGQPNIRNKIAHNQLRSDAIDIFGKSVAVQLKSLSDERGLLTQLKIQTFLTESGVADLNEKYKDRDKKKESSKETTLTFAKDDT